MSTITSANRNNIAFLLNRPLASNKQNKTLSSNFTSAIDSFDSQSAADEFKKLPGQTSIAYNLFHQMASEGLPSTVPLTGLDWKGEAVRNMLGIIYKDAQPEDQAKFDKVFREFEKVHTHFKNDKKVAPELSYLFAKYGKAALEKQISDYTQHCRNAWEYHHTGYDKSITDEDIFTPSTMACYEILDNQIRELTKPDQTWATIICSGTYFKDTCTALSKTLRHYDAVPASPLLAEPLLESIPQNVTSELPKVDASQPQNPDVFIPAGNGHAPITINNTVHGGNGTSTINGRSAEPHTASDIDFGIALLKTPLEQLGPEKARLVEKFMDLHWGRVKNGGQDRLTDHIEKVVSSTEPQVARVQVLSSPLAMQAVESFISIPDTQYAIALTGSPEQDSAPLQIVPQAIMASSSAISDINISEENDSAARLLSHSGNHLHAAAKQVTQALSGLLNQAESSLISTRIASDSASKEVTQPGQPREEVTVMNVNTMDTATPTQSQVQKLVSKFEKLNAEQHMRNESLSARSHLNSMGNTFNDKQQQLSSASAKPDFQPLTGVKNRVKESINQKQLYTTNRTIDPFSRHSTELKSSLWSYYPEKETEQMQPENDVLENLVSSL